MCPLCGSKAYIGFTTVECSKEGCPNYKPGEQSPNQGPRYKSKVFNSVFLYRLGMWDIRKFLRIEDDQCCQDLFLAYDKDNSHIRVQGSNDKETVRQGLKRLTRAGSSFSSCDD